MFLLFCRFVPVIAIAEIKGVLRPAHGSHSAHDSHSGYSDVVTPGSAGAGAMSRPSPDQRLRDTKTTSCRRPTAARKAGLEIVDVYTPYAVHGLDRAMGLPPSRLPWVSLPARPVRRA